MDELNLGLTIPSPPPKKEKNGVSWTAYHVQKPTHCDRCLAEVHAAWPNNTKAPNRAVYKRRQGNEITFWCSRHAEPVRAADDEGKKR